MNMHFMRFVSMLLVVMTAWLQFGQEPALAEAPAMQPGLTLESQGVELPGGSVQFPKLMGHPDVALAEQIQQTILSAGEIQAYLTTLPLLGQAERKLHVSWRGAILGDLISVWYGASGDAAANQPPHRWMSATLAATTGETISLSELFQEWPAAEAFLTTYMEEQVSPALSHHLQNNRLTPIPEQYFLSEAGITFLYPFAQLSTLSDRAGAVTVDWGVLQPYLNLREDTALARAGVPAMLSLTDQSRTGIQQDLEKGHLSGIPVAFGTPMQPLIDQYRLLADPDLYDGGRMVLLDDALFRDVWLLTDKLTDDFSNSVVQGIRIDRGCMWGLCVGITQRHDWITAFGEPDATLTLDEVAAELNRLVPGTSDYYPVGNHQLRLHADENGVLRSIIMQ